MSNGLNVEIFLAVVYMMLCDTFLGDLPRLNTWLSSGCSWSRWG